MHIVKVLLPYQNLFPLDYLVPQNLPVIIGDLAVVPFRNSETIGIIWDIIDKSKLVNLRTIKYILGEEFRLKKDIISLLSFASNYYITELGSIAKLVLPVNIAEPPIKIKEQILTPYINLPSLSSDQENALLQIQSTNKPSLLKGVTGSGKTEVYFHLLYQYLQQGQQVLIMLPEISLSNHIIQRFIERFGFDPAIWNSTITKAQKKMILRGIITGKVKIIIGARSSLFLPYNNLGLIIVDEEHDTSYKQDDGVLYNARDMAVLRGKLNSAKVILCSATPSIESLCNAQNAKYELIELVNRHQYIAMPKVQIIDMRSQKLSPNSWLSAPLVIEIKNKLIKNEQILLFLNRRGYAPLMLCKLCGYRFSCDSCSSWLVLHKIRNSLECHYCGHVSKIHTSCPECQSEESLIICGPGVDRIAEETQNLFPSSRIAVISKDHITKPERMIDLLQKMQNNEIDILVGTQMIAKGYHFPNLTLVGVIDADFGALGCMDLRGAEKTFQLLHQVGGRAGRADKTGLILMQTYYPDSMILKSLRDGKEDQFIEYEIQNRNDAEMPPFTKMASIILTDKNDQKLSKIAHQLVSLAPDANVKILGPARGLIAKLANKYRYRILVIANKKFNLQKYINIWLSKIKIPASCNIKVDIDPQNFM